jgi:segregation and condensation protein A
MIADDDNPQPHSEFGTTAKQGESLLSADNNDYGGTLRAVVLGQVMTNLPKDLYIPPDALEVVLESFEGPLDLLLYLIRKQNIDILDIPVAEITRQYMGYVEIMRIANLDLAAEYLVMAALLAEIKSRMLLPRQVTNKEDEEDPRAILIRRLQEYERYSQAATAVEDLPRLERDIHRAQVKYDIPKEDVVDPNVTLQQLMLAYERIVARAESREGLLVSRDTLSIRERMTDILKILRTQKNVMFEQLFKPEEGRLGVVVTFISLLELFRDDLLIIVQNEAFAPIHIRAAA